MVSPDILKLLYLVEGPGTPTIDTGDKVNAFALGPEENTSGLNFASVYAAQYSMMQQQGAPPQDPAEALKKEIQQKAAAVQKEYIMNWTMEAVWKQLNALWGASGLETMEDAIAAADPNYLEKLWHRLDLVDPAKAQGPQGPQEPQQGDSE